MEIPLHQPILVITLSTIQQITYDGTVQCLRGQQVTIPECFLPVGHVVSWPIIAVTRALLSGAPVYKPGNDPEPLTPEPIE